ncbi:MAG: GNAT family N-acetyltransferase [Clostridiaceae bacterium]|nr:GNAT family N-acetyltransferase [Clostridiaceae bacterium]
MEMRVKKFYELTLDELYEIIKERMEVFCVEQNIPYQDLDEVDKDAYHVFLWESGKILGYLRVYSLDEKTAKIGRVITTVRGKGYGEAVLKQGIKTAFETMGKDEIIIHSQSYCTGFYAKCGFEVYGEEFLEEQILHRYMRLKK